MLKKFLECEEVNIAMDELLKHKRYGMDWFIKWAGSIFIVSAVMCRVIELHFFDIAFTTVGTLCWLFVGLLWNDRSLIFLNTVILSVIFSALFV